MKNKIKTVKQMTYEGLGFPVVLQNVQMEQVAGEWLPKIDVEVLSERVFRLLPTKSAKLTGSEIKFIRVYLDKSRLAFSELFRLSHTAVAKWENAGNSPAPISPGQEMLLRLYLKDHLDVGHREFYQAYKCLEEAVYSEEEAILKLAL